MHQHVLKFLGLATAVVLLASTGSLDAGNITAKGSDTLVILAQKWAKVYMGLNPGTKIQATGGGSGTGFAALQNRTTDLCTASAVLQAVTRDEAGIGYGGAAYGSAGKALNMRGKEGEPRLDRPE